MPATILDGKSCAVDLEQRLISEISSMNMVPHLLLL